MTSARLRDALVNWGIDYDEAGFLFRVSKNTIYKWCHDKKPVPAMVGRMIQVIDLSGILDLLLDEYRDLQELENVR